MVQRFHGIDRHKNYSTVSVLNRDGQEVRFLRSCAMEDYLAELGAEDACGGVADHPEASCGSFYWADRQDARNMAKALWVFLVTGEFGIPTVYKPSETIRTLRRLFATYNLVNRQIRMLKNAIQAMLLDDGIVVTTSERSRLFTGRESVSDMIGDRSLSPPILSAIEIQVDLLRGITESKVALAERIVVASAPLAEQVKLLVTILRDHSNHRRGVPGGHWRRAAVQESATHERLPWTGTTVSRQRREGRVVCTNVGCDVRQALRRSPIDHRRPGLPAVAPPPPRRCDEFRIHGRRTDQRQTGAQARVCPSTYTYHPRPDRPMVTRPVSTGIRQRP